MANWTGFSMTNRGAELQAKVNAGSTTLTFTKLALGSGEAEGSLENMTELVHKEMDMTIKGISNEGNIVTLKSTITNEGISQAFYAREMGLYATDPDLGEILYAVQTDQKPDNIPAEGSATVVSEDFTAHLIMSNTGSVSAVLDTGALITLGDLNKHNEAEDSHLDIRQKITDDISEHNKDENAHSNLVRVKSMTTTDDGIRYTTQDGQQHGLNLWSTLKNALTGATAGNANKNTLFQQLDAIAGMIKKITGSANWYDNPAYSIQQLATMVNSVSAISEYDVDDPSAWWFKLRGAPGIIIQGGNSGQPNNYNIIVNYAIRYPNKPFFNIAIPIISDSDRTTYSISYTGDGGNSKAHFLSNMVSSPSVQYISFGY